MEKQIRKAAEEIAGGQGIKDEELPELTELTKCALEISHIAIIAFRGKLREKALKIAIDIVEYEDELKRPSENA